MAERYKILALDDEKFNLLLLKACLKDEPIDLVTCTAAPDALAAFKQDNFDLILLDIVMEGIDGFEARKLIRDINADVPIIFLTSMVDDMDSSLLKRISEDQHTYYLNKSFDKPTLLAKIQQAIRVYRDQNESDRYYRQLDADLTLAGDVQKIMLPNWCMSNDDVEISYLYLPRVKVSGDLFETIDLGDGLSLVLIGDIAGHGIQSALYMSAVLSFLKVLQGEFNPKSLQPNWVLNRINAFFLDDLNGDSYMTCLVAIFDFRNNRMVFQSAGHPGIFCCSTCNENEWSINPDGRGGIPIGWRRDYIYEESDNVSYEFTDDTVFLFLTDGALDIADQTGDMAEEKTLRMLLGVLSSESDLISMPFRLLQSMAMIGYTAAMDDICLAVVKKNAREESALKLFVEPDIAKVGDCAEKFGNFVQNKTHNAEVATRVELLLSEFLNNVVIHGLSSKLRTQSGMVVKVEVRAADVQVTVMDRGKSWNCGSDTGNADAELEKRNAAMATSGRGMAIVHSIAAAICRKRYGVLNETVFTVKR